MFKITTKINLSEFFKINNLSENQDHQFYIGKNIKEHKSSSVEIQKQTLPQLTGLEAEKSGFSISDKIQIQNFQVISSDKVSSTIKSASDIKNNNDDDDDKHFKVPYPPSRKYVHHHSNSPGHQKKMQMVDVSCESDVKNRLGLDVVRRSGGASRPGPEMIIGLHTASISQIGESRA